VEKHFEIITQEHVLSAVLHLPGEGIFPAIILCHGFMGNKIGMHRLFVKSARDLCQAGWAVLRFDYSGCGESSGEHRDLSLHQQINETLAVLDFITKHPSVDMNRLSLLGLSMGGCVAALTAARDPRVTQLILWSPVARPLDDLLHIVGQENMEQTMKAGTTDFEGFELGREFFKSLSTLHPLDEIAGYKGRCLIIHGTGDTEIDPGNAGLYFQALGHGCRARKDKLIMIPEADHTFSAARWETEILRHTLDFLEEEARDEEQVG